MLLDFDVMVIKELHLYFIGREVRGKVRRTLYGCANVERQTEVDNYHVNMVSVNCIDGIKTIQMKDNFE